MVEILQLVHEISSFPEVHYKSGDLKSFSKFTDAVTGCVLSEDILKNVAKFKDKHLCQSLF